MSPKTKTLADGLIERTSSMLDEIASLYTAMLDEIDVVPWCSGYHYCKNSIQLSLNSGSAQIPTLLAVCQRFTMVRISDNGPSWK